MPRPQFSIRTLMWLTLVVAVFFGGIHIGTYREHRRFDAQIRAESMVRLKEAWERHRAFPFSKMGLARRIPQGR